MPTLLGAYSLTGASILKKSQVVKNDSRILRRRLCAMRTWISYPLSIRFQNVREDVAVDVPINSKRGPQYASAGFHCRNQLAPAGAIDSSETV